VSSFSPCPLLLGVKALSKAGCGKLRVREVRNLLTVVIFRTGYPTTCRWSFFINETIVLSLDSNQRRLSPQDVDPRLHLNHRPVASSEFRAHNLADGAIC
jgi:hypothetical protein